MKYTKSAFVDPVAALQKFKQSFSKDEATACSSAGLSALQRRKKYAKTTAQSEALLVASQHNFRESDNYGKTQSSEPVLKKDDPRSIADSKSKGTEQHSVLSEERGADPGQGHLRRVRRSEHRHSHQKQQDVDGERYPAHPKPSSLVRETHEDQHRSVDARRSHGHSASAPVCREQKGNTTRSKKTKPVQTEHHVGAPGPESNKRDRRTHDHHVDNHHRERSRSGSMISTESADSMKVNFHGEGDPATGPIRTTQAQTMRKLNAPMSDAEVLLYAYKCNFKDMSQINSSGGPTRRLIAQTEGFLVEHFPDLVDHWPFYDGAAEPPRKDGSKRDKRDTHFFTKFMSQPAGHSDRGAWIYFLRGSMFAQELAQQEERDAAKKKEEAARAVRAVRLAAKTDSTYSAAAFDMIQDEELVAVKGHPKPNLQRRRNSMVFEPPSGPVEINPTSKISWSRYEMPVRRVKSEPCHRTDVARFSILKATPKVDPSTMRVAKEPLAQTVPKAHSKEKRLNDFTKHTQTRRTNMRDDLSGMYDDDVYEVYEQIRVPRRYGEMPHTESDDEREISHRDINMMAAGRRTICVFYTAPGTRAPSGVRIHVPMNGIMPGAGWTAWDLKCALFEHPNFAAEVHTAWMEHMAIVVPKPVDDSRGRQRTALVAQDDDLLWDVGVRVPGEVVVEFPGFQV